MQALVEAGPANRADPRAAKQVAQGARGACRWRRPTRSKCKRREQELATRRAEIERGRGRNLALIDSQLADTVAVSPVNGVVLVKSADVGEVLAPGTTVLTIGDIDHPWLRGYINEPDLGEGASSAAGREGHHRFVPGQSPTTGKISFIASEAEFTPKQIQTQQERVKLVYRIKIEVENPDARTEDEHAGGCGDRAGAARWKRSSRRAA